MILKNSQIEQFKRYMLEKFFINTILFLRNNFPEWCEGKNDEELGEFINLIMKFGKNYQIYSEVNLQKLMHYQILYKFDIPVHPKLEAKLSDFSQDENFRIENFYLGLESGNYRLTQITLDYSLRNKQYE